MFRHAVSYLAVAVLFAANSLGAATENHATAKDESKAKLPTLNKKTVGKQRALQGTPFWTKVGQTLLGQNEDDYFGFAADISPDGSVIAVGAGGYDDGNTTDTGKVTVYMKRKFKKGPRWIPKGEPILGSEDDEQGWVVKLAKNGNILAVGSDDANDDAGHVKVFAWGGQPRSWKQLGQTIVGDASDDESGWGIDLSDDGLTIVIGSPEHDNGGDDSYDSGLTKIYTYHRPSKTWKLKGSPIIGYNNVVNETDAYYGWTVGIDGEGDRVITGGPYDSTNEFGYTGAVMVFDYDNDLMDWVQVGETLWGNGTETEFGISVAMSKDGNTIAVSAGCYYYCEYNDRIDDDFDGNHNDYVHIYRMIEGMWALVGELFPEDYEFGFGQSVTLSDDGTKLGVGAASYDNGKAKVFQYNGDYDWTQVGQDLFIEDWDSGKSNKHISLSGDGMNLIVGAEEGGKKEGGLVNVYKIADDESTSPVAGCQDSRATFKWPTGKGAIFTCKRVKPKQCSKDFISSMCPLKCGKCLDNACDDPTLKIKVGKNKFEDCDWVAEDPKARCKPVVASACRKTCYSNMYDLLCQDKPPATRSPTASPTVSAAPTLPCEEKRRDNFFWFYSTKAEKDVIKKCAFLQDMEDDVKKDKICGLADSSSQGIPPAKEVCRVSCGVCSPPTLSPTGSA